MEQSMNTLLIGSFIVNIFISLSMKKLLESIRVFQIIAFFILIQISFPPLANIYLQTIFSFATFKIVPKEIIR